MACATIIIGMPTAFRFMAVGFSVMAVIMPLTPALAAEPGLFRVDPVADEILGQYCIDCHEDGTEKGDVRLDNLAELSLDARLDLMNRVLEKVHFEEMPPKKKKNQPSEEERTQLEDWLKKNLQEHNASKLEEKLRMPEYGNKVDHDKLFSGKYKELPGFTPDRRWLISEFIFDAKFNKLLGHSPSRDIDGKRVRIIGDNNRTSVNLTNPFLLPTHSGVRYYDTTTLDGGHLLTMITNAKQASASLIKLAKGKGQFPAIHEIMASEWNHEKMLAERESYLNENIEPLLRDLFKEKHEELLPSFVATTPALYTAVIGPDGRVIKKPELQYVVPDREEVEQIVKSMRKHSQDGEKDEDLILKCEKDWFDSGVSERTIHARVSAMHNHMDELRLRLQKPQSKSVTITLADSELAILRSALLTHRKPEGTYSAIIAKCVAAWSGEFQREREQTSITEAAVNHLVEELFTNIIERAPTSSEKTEYTELAKSYFQKIGTEETIEKIIQTLILHTDFVYRQEFGVGPADGHGRRMLSSHDASFALAYALTDSSPDKELQDAARSGRLETREDYRREVERMLKVRSQACIVDEAVERIGGGSSFTHMPIRELRFFREFFGYPNLLSIFKDNKRFGGDYNTVASRVVSEADILVEHILEQDANVFETLLTTEDFYVFHSGDNEQMAKSSAQVRKIYEHFKDKDWKNFDNDDMKEHLDFFLANEVRGVNATLIADNTKGKDLAGGFKITMSSYTDLLGSGQANAVPFSATAGHGKTEGATRTGNPMRAPEVAKCFNIDLKNWNYPTTQPTKMQHRKGMLTHPAWLIAFAGNTETDPIRRGKWVREKLLAGSVPDVPVTVDAVIPEDHHNTLRGRLEKKTKVEYCWGCHEQMNPLGLSFEKYDDFGRYRMEEFLEHPDNLVKKMPDKGPPQDDLRDIYKTLPVDSSGYLEGTGDENLDGEIKDAIDLAERLGKSTKVRQSIIRHAFRYFMGRNEILSDSKALIDADQAYLQSGGSFDAVILSLLTSDSFIYRKAISY